MKIRTLATLAAAAAITCASALADDHGRGRGGDNQQNDRRDRRTEVPAILEWNTMIGNPRPYVGSANPIRGINAGGLPWVIGAAKGELTTDGHLELRVTGLVFDPSDSGVLNAGLANQNPVPSFRAIVSCLSKDASGAATTVNVMTDAVPATLGSVSSGGGNASFDTFVALPKPCIAPIVFVTSPNGAWFASTGL